MTDTKKPEPNPWLRELWAKITAGDEEAFILLISIAHEPHRVKELTEKFKATGRV